jgi:hypothetical protein
VNYSLLHSYRRVSAAGRLYGGLFIIPRMKPVSLSRVYAVIVDDAVAANGAVRRFD